jgi:uncharacterized membrane protein YjgN (DUF898 family)
MGPVVPQPDAQPQTRRLSFHGDGGTLLGIMIVNLLLSVITLGIYQFWGKTRMRAYTHSQLDFDGDRFAYHGTGKELLIGWLKALVLIGVVYGPVVVFQIRNPGPGPVIVSGLVVSLFVIVLTPIIMVGSRRYRMSRASWRGIRFSFRGRARDFLRIFIRGWLLTVVTLGLYSPFFYNEMWRYLVTGSYFGSERFEFDGEGRDMFGRYLLALILTVPTLGLYWFWYWAARQRYYWSHISFRGARFQSAVQGGPLFRFTLGNMLLVIFTLGLAVPWVIVRNFRFICRYVTLEGPVDLSVVRQETVPVSATGEEVADFLGLDVLGLVPN